MSVNIEDRYKHKKRKALIKKSSVANILRYPVGPTKQYAKYFT